MKNALVRAVCSAPDSEGWKRTPWRTIQGRQVAEARITSRASASSV